MRYLFFSFRTKPFVRLLTAGIFAILILYFLIRFPVWWILVIVPVIGSLYLLSRLGSVRIRDGGEVIVRGPAGKAKLTAPLQYHTWWSYLFESVEAVPASTQSLTRGNDLHVFLEVKDSTGREVIFLEYIGYDGRFPNQTPHDEQKWDPDKQVFLVQRVDKLLEFLESQVKPEEGTGNQ